MIRKTLFLTAACAVPLFTACVDGEGEDDDVPALGESQAALSVGRTMTHDSTTSDEWVALTSQATCFLRGVTGSLYGQPFMQEGSNGFPIQTNAASAEVFVSGGSWWVHAQKGLGGGVRAHVQCIAVPFDAAHHATQMAWQDNLSPSSVPDTSGRQCYLSKVWGTSGFGTSTNNVTLTRSPGVEWTLSGFVRNIDGDFDFGGAKAVCVDQPAASVENHTATGPDPDFTIDIDTLATNTGTGACGLIQIKGDWYDWTEWGWNAGVFAYRDNPPTWMTYATDSRVGKLRCLT